MYHGPRRPYYHYRSEDMPLDSSTSHVSVIDSKRFWDLLNKLTRRKETAKAQATKSDTKAVTG